MFKDVATRRKELSSQKTKGKMLGSSHKSNSEDFKICIWNT